MADSARDWLFGLEASGITLGLAPIRALLAALGHPEHSFTSITVAGTNGKGSVTAMIERGLRASGCRTGRYTSPHLTTIEERVALNGAPVDTSRFDHAAALVREAADQSDLRPSYFEATTALAMVAFRAAGVEVAVLEVGLGGRLDATNAVDSPLAVITNIGLDHQAYLGDTVAAIAAEKAGVIKTGASVVAGRTSDEARSVLVAAARSMGAAFTYAPEGVEVSATLGARGTRLSLRTHDHDYGDVRLALPGQHQVENAVTAVRALEAVRACGMAPVDAMAIRAALSDVRWPGRLDWRTWRGHDVLVDGAHNPDGARALADFVRDAVGGPAPIVVGIMRDKAIDEMVLALAPVASAFICTAPSHARAASPEDLADIVTRLAPRVACITASTPLQALTRASAHGSPIVVAGSLFLAGDILALVA